MFRVEIHIKGDSDRWGTYMREVDTLEDIRAFCKQGETGDVVKIWDLNKPIIDRHDGKGSAHKTLTI